MNVLRLGLALCAALTCLPRDAAAITTNSGQSWTFEPDAWTRANDADTSWFGWDALEGTHPIYPAPPDGFFRILDDSTPDVGGVTTALDHISATAPASGVGGFTTVLLQVLGQPGNEVDDLEFIMESSWTKVKDLYSRNENGAGVYWQEWTAPGNDLPLSISMTSPESSRALDAFQVDTFWTAGNSPRINSRTTIPEPRSIALSVIALSGAILALRKRRVL